jgi:phage gp29-like protein
MSVSIFNTEGYPMTIVDIHGKPLQQNTLQISQTSRIAQLHGEFANHPSNGLTPPRLASILKSAEAGDIRAQCELFQDMEEKDAHLLAEIGKRRRALTTVDWEVIPPRDASAAERAADGLNEVLQDLPDFEDLLFDLFDAIGKGFSCIELDWERYGNEWMPAVFNYREASWFQLDSSTRKELRLRDGSADGEALNPFGWIVHTHKAKSGYVARGGLYRVLAWPYLFKNYAVRDLAEFLEIYGVPVRQGKHPNGATNEEKATLLRAVVNIGHNAAGNVHNELRHDLLQSDAKQVASTLRQYLRYPLLVLNKGGERDPRRLPRFRFDLVEPEDMGTYAEALPKLVGAGMQIPVNWVHEKLRIPQPGKDGVVLSMSAPSSPLQAAARLVALKV